MLPAYNSTTSLLSAAPERISSCFLIPNIIIESLPLLKKTTASLPNPVNKIGGFLCIATMFFKPNHLLNIAGCTSMRVGAFSDNHVFAADVAFPASSASCWDGEEEEEEEKEEASTCRMHLTVGKHRTYHSWFGHRSPQTCSK